MKTIGKYESGKCYVYHIGRKLIVTNVNRASLNNTRKILKRLSDMNVIKLTNEAIEENIKSLHEELKNLGSLHSYVNIKFQNFDNVSTNKNETYASLTSDNFGGGYDLKEVKIILV